MSTIRTIPLSLATLTTLAIVMAAAPSTQPADCCEPVAAVASARFAAPATQPAKTDAAALFEKLKGLAGTWNAEGMGESCTYEYTVTGNGSAVVENQSAHGGMMTVYTLDAREGGEPRVVVTHYCGAGNQPRMASAGLAGDHADFGFLDATGMKRETDTHMHQLALTFNNDGTITQDWTLFMDGKDAGAMTIKLKRAV